MSLAARAAALIAAAALPPAAASATALTNGDFETGDFTGWTVGISPTYAEGGRPYFIDTTGDGWVVSNSSQGALSIAPHSGFSAFNGFDGGVVEPVTGDSLPEADLTFFLMQAFSFAAPLDSAALSFVYDINGGPAASGRESRFLTVEILDAVTLEVLDTVYSFEVNSANRTNAAVPLTSIDMDIAAPLNALGAGAYFLNFGEHIPQWYTGAGTIMLDSISLTLEESAQVPLPAAAPALLAALGALGVAARRRRG